MNYLPFFYILFLISFDIFSYLFLDPNLFYFKKFYTGFSLNQRLLTSLIYTIFIFVFFIFYYIFITESKKGGIKLRNLILINCIVLFFSYPAILSYDIFNYIASAKVFFHYHENPYLFIPNQFLGDPLLAFTRASNKILLYGPFFLFTTGFPFLLGFGNFIITLFNFKLLMMIFYLLLSYLIYKTGDSFSTTVFALNPLIIIESLVSSHNDIFMIFFALFSFFLLYENRKVRSFISFFLSFLVKYATLFLLPIFLFCTFKITRREKINWGRVYLFASLSMFIIFILSFIREEIYPWYAIWVLSFLSLVSHKRVILYLILSLSFGLLLSYIPYIATGNYFGTVKILKIILSFGPSVLVILFYSFKKRLWFQKLPF